MTLMDSETYDKYPELQVPGETVVNPIAAEVSAIDYLQGKGAPANAIVVSTTATGITFEGWKWRIIRFVQLKPDGQQKYDGSSQKTCWDPDIDYAAMKNLGMIA